MRGRPDAAERGRAGRVVPQATVRVSGDPVGAFLGRIDGRALDTCGPTDLMGTYPVPAYLNRVSTAVPDHEVNASFLTFARGRLTSQPRSLAVFDRMAKRSGIERRYSTLRPRQDPDGESVDEAGVFRRGAFPGTAARMDAFEAKAPDLAMRAVAGLDLGADVSRITHLVVASCTGFTAPGLDLELVARLGLDPSVERTMIGFMGCYAAINALKLARHVVRSEPDARVLVVNCELCTLHLKDTDDLETLLTFCLWGDGCSAALVSGDADGLRLDSFRALLAADSADLMSWRVRDDGFDMVLSGQVPAAVGKVLDLHVGTILGGADRGDISHWAVHPGGKSVLDVVEQALELGASALLPSRDVLRLNGNMSSATVMFVLGRMLDHGVRGERGCAMAFGPGLTAETMLFEVA